MDDAPIEAPSHTLILWDGVDEPSEDIGPAYRGNGYGEQDYSIQSLLKYADTHGERLRSKYLAWVYDLVCNENFPGYSNLT